MNIPRNVGVDSKPNGIWTRRRAEVQRGAAEKQAISGELLFEREKWGGK